MVNISNKSIVIDKNPATNVYTERKCPTMKKTQCIANAWYNPQTDKHKRASQPLTQQILQSFFEEFDDDDASLYMENMRV